MLTKLFKIIVILIILRACTAYILSINLGSAMLPTLMSHDFIIINRFAYNIKLPLTNLSLFQVNTPERGDVVLHRGNQGDNKEFIHRIVGIGGDYIKYNDITGQLSVIPDYEKNNCKMKDCQFHHYSYENGKVYSSYIPYPMPEYHNKFIEYTEVGKISHQILLEELRQKREKIISLYFKQEDIPIGEWIVPKDHYFVLGDNRDHTTDSRFIGFIPRDNLSGKPIRILLNSEMEERFLKIIQ